jgi:hypothetical protein
MRDDDVWGHIDPRNWRETVAIRGRVASEEDVREGSAVFFVASQTSTPYDIALPAPAILREDGTGEPTPVIVIQAEQLGSDSVAVGFRFLPGGNGLCTLAELEFLAEPDERFTRGA